MSGRAKRKNANTVRLLNAPASVLAVLFDLDGTLIATKQLYLEAYRRALEGYVGRLLTDQELLAFDSRSERRMLGNCVSHGQLDQCHALFHRHYQQLHETHFEGIYPGVQQLLNELRVRGIKLGIVTGKSRVGWGISSAAAAGLGVFDVVICNEDVTAPKPDPCGLRLAIQAVGAQPGNTLYVGDSTVDIGAALAAGITPVAALWSRTDERRAEFEAYANEHHTFLAYQPDSLLQLL